MTTEIVVREDNTAEERSIVVSDGKGGQLVVRESELMQMVSTLSAALDVFYGQGRLKDKEPRNAWEALRENTRLREQNRLLGERFKQQEGVIRSAFARALKGVSGVTPKVQVEAAQLVTIVNDHYDAEQLLKAAGIPFRNVASAVRRLIAERATIVEAQPFAELHPELEGEATPASLPAPDETKLLP
jgi:hypothetical protein